MTRTRLFFIISFLFLLVAACKQKPKKESPDDKLPIELKIVKLSDKEEWGYDIYVDHKRFIKQDRIPAINGIHTFVSEEEAGKVAKVVIEKIKKGKVPVVTEGEIQKLNITIR